MLTLLATLAVAACSPKWEPDAATRAEEGYPVLVWNDPATCETLVVTAPHKEAGGLQATLLWFAPDGRVRQRFVLPKTMWPSNAAVDAKGKRVYLLSAQVSAEAVELHLEARRLSDFSLVRGFGSAGRAVHRAPRHTPDTSATGGEAVLLIDGSGRPVIVAVAESIKGPSALYALRLDEQGLRDPTWRAPSPVSLHERTNSNELVATLMPDGALAIGAGARLLAQVFRLLPDGSLDERFGTKGRVTPATSSALAIMATPDGALHLVARDRGQRLVTLDDRGTPGASLSWRALEDRSEIPEVLLAVPGERRLVVARSFSYASRQSALVLTLWRRDGTLDPAFGADGLLVLDEPTVDFRFPKATLDAAGRVLLAVQRGVPDKPTEGALTVMRFALPPPGEAPSPRAVEESRPPARSPWASAPEAETPPAPSVSRAARPPPTPSPPQPEERPAAPAPAPPPSEAQGVFVYTDERGVETWVDSLEKVPARFRARARRLSP
jgi:hypothetical protein